MRLYPADYRAAYGDEIAATLQDAQDEAELHVGLRDSLSLAAAGIEIRMRSYRSQDWYFEVEHGVALGIRVALFAIAGGAAAFLWSAGIGGRSIYGGSDYLIASRLLFAVVLAPWIGVFVAQLYGWWRTAVSFAAIGTAGVLALVAYKLGPAPFGVGSGPASALVVVVIGLALVTLGRRMRIGQVHLPVLIIGIWAGSVVAYTSYLQGLIQRMPRPIVTAAVVFALLSVGMAIAGKPRGLIACAMLTFPTWMLGAGVFYIGFPAGLLEFIVWTFASVVFAAALSGIAVSVAAANERRSA